MREARRAFNRKLDARATTQITKIRRSIFCKKIMKTTKFLVLSSYHSAHDSSGLCHLKSREKLGVIEDAGEVLCEEESLSYIEEGP